MTAVATHTTYQCESKASGECAKTICIAGTDLVHLKISASGIDVWVVLLQKSRSNIRLAGHIIAVISRLDLVVGGAVFALAPEAEDLKHGVSFRPMPVGSLRISPDQLPG